jgi:ribosomal protein S27E
MAIYECLMPHCRAEVYRRRDVCDPCWDDRRGQLDSLPELYVMTYALLTPGSRVQDIPSIHVKRPDSGVPFSLVAFDALEQAHDRMMAWARWLLATRGQQINVTQIQGGTGYQFNAAVAELRRGDGRLAMTDFAGDYVLDVWTVYRRLATFCLPNAPRHLNVTCPICDNVTVITRHADEYAACLTCATEWPHSQLSKISKRVAA